MTFRQIREGKKKTLEECFAMEYRLAQRFMVRLAHEADGVHARVRASSHARGPQRKGSDFFEGVRALLVDGDKKPKVRGADDRDCGRVVDGDARAVEPASP